MKNFKVTIEKNGIQLNTLNTILVRANVLVITKILVLKNTDETKLDNKEIKSNNTRLKYESKTERSRK